MIPNRRILWSLLTAQAVSSFNCTRRASGNGNGRVYSLTATVGDLAGNTADRDGNLIVPHDKGK